MAPLNIAWLLQALDGARAPRRTPSAPGPLLPVALVPVFLWLVAGTADRAGARLGRGVGAPRPERLLRRPGRRRRARRGAGHAHRHRPADRRCWTAAPPCGSRSAVLAGADGDWWAVGAVSSVWLVGITVVAVVVGAWMAGRVARRPGPRRARAWSRRGTPAREHPGLRPRRAGAHRPGRHLALGADAARHGGARAVPRPGRDRRRVHLGQARRSSPAWSPRAACCCSG